MLYHVLYPFADQFGPLNLFRYLTFRTGGALLTAMLISFLFGQPIIEWLRSRQARASRSATTARKATSSPRRARPPWAGS